MKSKIRLNLFFIFLLSSSFPFLSSAQWTVGSGSLSSSDRVILSSSNQQSTANKRMNIVTNTDRIGLFVENTTTAASGVPPVNPGLLCMPGGVDLEDLYFGLYVASPSSFGTGGFAGYFDGFVGICGGLVLNNQEFSNNWNVVDLYGDGLSFIGSSSAGEFRLLRTPTGTDAYANIILEDGNNKALEIFRGSPLAEDDLGTSNFFVQGNGAVDTKFGITIHNGQTTKPIQLLTGDTGEERFSVKNNGHIFTETGLRITTATDEWRPLEMVSADDGSQVFHVTRQGTVVAKKGFEIHSDSTTHFKVSHDGHVAARELRVTLKPIPDYVFEPDYDLKTLKELEDYITKNKHLPNIPSAKEIEKNGIGVGDLQIRELEKIEELTLYILQLNKRLEKLEKENEILKADNKE